MLASTIIKAALRKIGALSRGFEPSSDDMAEALQELNSMIRGWANEELLIPYYTRENFTLTAGQISFTIGAAATLATTRPIDIASAYIRDADSKDTPLERMSLDEANRVLDKTTQAKPSRFHYAYGDPNGTIYLDCAIDYAYVLYIFSRKPLTVFTAITEATTFPAEYDDLVTHNLAVRLAPEVIGSDAPRTVIELAKQLRRDAKSAVEGREIPVLRVDDALLRNGGQNYNIDTE